MGYYLEEHPNLAVPQYGWPRTKVSGVIGVHTTESGVVPAGADPGAENTAGYISRRTNYGSYHILADWDTIVPLTRPTFAAWADTTNNVHALSVSGAMDAARWRDLSPERAAGIVRNMGIAAAMLVRDAIAHGVLDEVVPARRITAAEAIAGTKAGFYGHGETNPGTRYDPGQNFDWDLFLSSYAAAVGGSGITYASTEATPLPVPEEDDEMLTIFRDTAAANPDQTWIGNALFKSKVRDPQHLADLQLMAAEGKMSIAKGGAVQVLPEGLFGIDIELLLPKAQAQAVVHEPFTYLEPRTGNAVGTTTIAAALGGSDLQHVATRDNEKG